jgi:uncharacterized DUF497 family protein
MQFDWDPKKAKENLKKHGVSFDEAVAAPHRERKEYLYHRHQTSNNPWEEKT